MTYRAEIPYGTCWSTPTHAVRIRCCRSQRMSPPGTRSQPSSSMRFVLLREAQYRDALANDHVFQKRYMSLPFEISDSAFKKTVSTIPSHDGIRFSTREGLAALIPTKPGGTVTFGGQTHPADGKCRYHSRRASPCRRAKPRSQCSIAAARLRQGLGGGRLHAGSTNSGGDAGVAGRRPRD